MTLFKRFDVEVELQNLGYPPPKVPKVPKVAELSGEDLPPTLGTLGGLGRGEGQTSYFPPSASTCSCGHTTGVWLFNAGTCWAHWVCQRCVGRETIPPTHLCDPALPITEPCKGTESKGIGDTWICPACGRCVPLLEKSPNGRRCYLCPNGDGFISIPTKPGNSYTPSPGEAFTPGPRDFLPRPLSQENNSDVWSTWAPLFVWLIEHYPDHFHAVCEAEEAIRVLERRGITAGQEYEAACDELLRQFEVARRLKLRQEVKVRFQ